MLKSFLAILLALTLPSCGADSNQTNHSEIISSSDSTQLADFIHDPVDSSDVNLNGIRLVRCISVKGLLWSGSMVHYNGVTNQYLSAAHVARGAICYDAATRTQLQVNYVDNNMDFAVFESPVKLDDVVYKLSCHHMSKNHKYHAVGWADGNNLTSQDLIATSRFSDSWFIIGGITMNHLRELDGYIIPGQSGGAVFDDHWVVYGINNASDNTTNKSWSRELADTPLCK